MHEYIVGDDAPPRIAVANNSESHQPLLHFLLEAGWQHDLGIPGFTSVVVKAKFAGFSFHSLLTGGRAGRSE